MILPILSLYSFCLLVSIFKNNNIDNRLICLFLLISMCLISIFRPDTMLDYQDYKEAFDIEHSRMEPTFILITTLIKAYSGDFILLVAFYAILGISLKLWIIKKCSVSFSLSILIYLSNFFLLHDMIQMRVSVSGALFLISLYYNNIGKKYISIFLILISILFHYSAILLVFIFFLNREKINKKLYVSLIPLCYCLALLHIGIPFIIRNLGISYIQVIFEAYENNIYVRDSSLNIFNVVQLLKIVLATILLLKINMLKHIYPMSVILVKVYIISISFYALFSEMPVIAVRVSELIGVVEILLIPCLIYLFRPRKIGYSFVILISLFVLVMNVFYNNILKY